MSTQVDEVLSTEDELDLSGDSAVEIVTAIFTISDAEFEETESDKGSGERMNLTFQSEEFPYDITVRFFVLYEPSDSSKNTDWVKRQRGQLKNVIKAAGLDPARVRAIVNPDSDNYIVGKQVQATTRDGGDGFATLGRFKKTA